MSAKMKLRTVGCDISDIVSINTKNVEDTTIINMTISCRDIEHFNSIMTRIRGIKDVIRVTRMVGTK